MTRKERLLEFGLRLMALGLKPAPLAPHPKSIFVLRNNDIGDLLVATPLFEALRRRFPDASIVAGVGRWNVDVLKHNPFVSDVMVVNTPWHNHVVPYEGLGGVLKYIFTNDEVRQIKRRKFDVAIDMFGSQFTALLLLRAAIPYKQGVKDYRGGHSVMQQCTNHDPFRHVAQSALEQARLLGATDLPLPRPQLFLTAEECAQAEQTWAGGSAGNRPLRVVLAAGAGDLNRCWPLENYATLIPQLERLGTVDVAVVGTAREQERAETLTQAAPFVRNLTGTLALRETFALIASADLVICNPSMMQHAAAAFFVPTLVLMGPAMKSASQETQQWGYPETCLILGRDEDRSEIASSAEALEAIRRLLAQKTLPQTENVQTACH